MSEQESTPVNELMPVPAPAPQPAASLKQKLAGVCSSLDKLMPGGWPRIAACAAGGAVLLVMVFGLMGSGSIDSDDAFLNFYDDALEELKDDKVQAWSDLKQRRNHVESALRGIRGGDEEAAFRVALMMESLPALDYLIMKKGFRLRGELLDTAVLLGNVEICRYLVEEQGLETRDKHMALACECGHVELCQYLVNEQGLDATDPDLLVPMLRSSVDAYQMQLGMTALLTGRLGDLEELVENHIKIARFLVENGVDITDDRVRCRLNECVNTELKEYLLEELED